MTFTHIQVRFKMIKEQQGIKESRQKTDSSAFCFLSGRKLKEGNEVADSTELKLVHNCKQSAGLNSEGTRGCVCNMTSSRRLTLFY